MSAETLEIFIKEQKKHWKTLKCGTIPKRVIIEVWIESCEFALDDLKELKKKAGKRNE